MMNKTTISINGVTITLLFGMWTLARLADRGYKLNNFQDALNDNPLDFIHSLLYLSACNAEGRDLNAYDEGIFWDYLDEQGLSGDGVQSVLTAFTDSLSKDVPQKKSRTKSSAARK